LRGGRVNPPGEGASNRRRANETGREGATRLGPQSPTLEGMMALTAPAGREGTH